MHSAVTDILRCPEGARNGRAYLLLLIGAFVVGGMVTIVAMFDALFPDEITIGTVLFLVFFWCLVLLVAFGALNGCGILLTDQFDGCASRGVTMALKQGLWTTLKGIAVFLLWLVVAAVLALIIWTLNLLGQLPGIGLWLTLVTTGLAALIATLGILLLLFGLTLSQVALWQGQGVGASVRTAVTLVICRPLEVVLHFSLLGFFVTLISSVVMLLAALGTSIAFALRLTGSAAGLTMPTMGSPAYLTKHLFVSLGGGLSGSLSMFSITFLFIGLVAMLWLVQAYGSIAVFNSLRRSQAPAGEASGMLAEA